MKLIVDRSVPDIEVTNVKVSFGSIIGEELGFEQHYFQTSSYGVAYAYAEALSKGRHPKKDRGRKWDYAFNTLLMSDVPAEAKIYLVEEKLGKKPLRLDPVELRQLLS